MRRYKAVARIFLFLSIFNFTFAGAPTMHKMRINLMTEAGGVTEASERGHTRSEGLHEWLGGPPTAGHLQSRFDIAAAQSFNYPEDLEDKKFFNKELNRKLKEYLVLGAIAGVFAGVANGIQKEIIGTVSPGAQTIGRAVEPLDEHPQGQEDPVSRSLSNVTDGELKMLSIISRRMLQQA